MTSSGDRVMGDSVLDNSKSTFMNQIPKFGILIPNRVFVGSIAASTTEAELKHFFSMYGAIKDCKIIVDKAGVSKGYGFVTFENAEDASKLLKEEGEHLFFKDRKLNIGPAVRKQQTTSTPVLEAGAGGGALVYANGSPLAFPNVMPLISGLESLGFPHMAAASYPLMFGGHQQFIMPPNYYSPSSSLAASALQWGATVGSSPQLHWAGQQSAGLPLGANGHLAGPASAALPLHSASPGHYLYQYPPLTTAFLPPQEMIYPHTTGLHYPEVDSSDSSTSAEASSSSQGSSGVLMDSGGVSGQVQYIEVSPYAAAASSLVHGVASASIESQTITHAKASSNNLDKSSSAQNYGIKRVLAVPRQVVCAPSNPYGFYSVPPVKIIAGQGGQRIVTKSVGTTEIQILPKTQS